MIYTITLNPSLDYIVRTPHFQTGGINRTENEMILAGGKGINVAIVLSHLGFPACALGFTAGFTGRQIEVLLQEQGIQTDFVQLKSGVSRVNVKIWSDEETEINGRGPVIPEEDLASLFARLSSLKEGDYLVLSGSVPASLPASVYRDLICALNGKSAGVIVDAEGSLLMETLPYHPFMIKPNHHELGEIFGVKLETHEDVVPWGRKLQKAGARNVLVSMAAKGAVLLSEDGRVFAADAPEGILRNSVGAGDSMTAGFLGGWLETHDYEKAFQYAVCTGSASAFSDRFAEREDVESLLKKSAGCFRQLSGIS